MMKWSLLPLVLAFLGCVEQPTREQLASMAAKGYYDHLARGEYNQFLEGIDKMAFLDSLEMTRDTGLSFRSQLSDNLRQYMTQLEQLHGGISEVCISNVRTDTLTDYTSVFLVLCFKDSTKEEVVVPMVERENGCWRMRQ